MKVLISVIILLAIIYATQATGVRKVHDRPKVMGDLIPYKALSPTRRKVQNKIVLIHNYFRSIVKPAAANMLRMKWHGGAARAAQKWASSCVYLTHDNKTSRYFKKFGYCGQNIFVSSQKVPWLFAIKSWFSEKVDFIYGQNNYTEVVGHYTQLVWGSTHKVGCGIKKCQHPNGVAYFNYVCDYCPSGNFDGYLGQPYKRGESCSLCKNHCKSNLCSNPCPFTDKYSNCGTLDKLEPKTFCKIGGLYRRDCKATCMCKDKIYQKFD